MRNVENAFITSIMGAGLGVDLVFDNGGYALWNGTAYDNKAGVYNVDAPHILCKHFPSVENVETLDKTNRLSGFYQLIARVKNDAGTWLADDIIAKVKVALGAGKQVSYSGQKVDVLSLNVDGGRNENGFYQKVIRINYAAMMQR